MSIQKLEELRIALVMNGGVSLAVWIGGVTNEIWRLVNQTHPVYREILRLTNTVASVDVISGTSAGGINGAALALSMVYGGQFDELRKIWLECGAFEDLLRSPFETNPGSILRGDAYFLPHIEASLTEIASGPTFNPASELPIDLQLTTTLLTGRRVQTVDSLGVKVQDVDYRGRFHFKRGPQIEDDFADRTPLIKALSRAARSTSSFPFAFEPSVIETGEDARLFDAIGNPLTVKRHVIDGGILDNKPIRGALQAIFHMRRTGSVRRVLAYINPDPGDGPRPRTTQKMPSLASVMSASLLGIPQSQSITDQLEEIAEHNHAVQTRRSSVLNVIHTGRPNGLLAKRMFTVYRKRRIANTCQLFVFTLFPSITSTESEKAELPAKAKNDKAKSGNPSLDELEDALSVMGKQSRAAMQLTFENIHWNTWIPTKWPALPSAPENENSDKWAWGMYPVEFFSRVSLDVLRLTQKLSDISSSLDELANEIQHAHQLRLGLPADATRGAAEPYAPSGTPHIDDSFGTWSDPDIPSNAQTRHGRKLDDPLSRLWRRAYRIIALIKATQNKEDEDWKPGTLALLEKIANMRKAAQRGNTAPGNYAYIPDEHDFRQLFSFLDVPSRRRRCARLAYLAARLVQATCREAYRIASDLRNTEIVVLSRENLEAQTLRRHKKICEMSNIDVAVLSDVEAYVKFVSGTRVTRQILTQATHESDEWTYAFEQPVSVAVFRLLQLEVIEYSLNDRDELADDTLVEFVQISGDSKSPLSTSDYADAKRKLLGLQVAHFAAFYKQSWRANDWTFGRLDGSERLIKILLNPERLQMRYFDAATAVKDIKNIALESVSSSTLKAFLSDRWNRENYEISMTRELQFLDNNTSRLPDVLPVCAEVLTLRLHMGILHDELPHVMRSVKADQDAGANPRCRGSSLLYSLGSTDSMPVPPISPKQAADALKEGLIADERLMDEVGSDLFTRTLAHTLAATQGTLASGAAKLGPLSVLSASLRTPIVGFYLAARGLTYQSRTSAALNGGVLAVGIVLVLIHLLSLKLLPGGGVDPASTPMSSGTGTEIPGIFATFGWALFAYGLAMTILRRLSWLLVAVAVAIIVYAASHSPDSPPGALFVLTCIATLALVSTRYVWLQTVVGLCAILAAGAAATGKVGCMGDWALWRLRLLTGSPDCPLPRPSDDTFFLSIIVVLTLILAIMQETRLRRGKKSANGKRGN
ncbi:patatin-like protein [Paraburkholderia humisilvae]|uniref:PNPLA domain-containing protein n=1 Tax=Paraburkholderia humisilvae TaxID=627669 RepID=A0A6J5CXV0_9BURK|nr:patatin-like protein [Paraburkholderia humisilvae]CAB3745675.1 hypothetical protein LMG29542_00012 [Paraburkholderia humisilvae]